MNQPTARGSGDGNRAEPGISPDDVALFEAARRLLLDRGHPTQHAVAAAVRGASGTAYFGLHLGSRRVNVCAESSAIANMVMAGDAPVAVAVAVCLDERGTVVVTNPCGVCREMFSTYAPGAQVLVDRAGEVAKVTAEQLMPEPWMLPHETSWTVREPRPVANTPTPESQQ